MVEHLVWFQFRASAPTAEVEALMERLRGLSDKVPGIVRIKAGENFTDRSGGFTHGLVVTLESTEALQRYATHPEHRAVADDIRALTDTIAALDFEH